MTKQSIDGLKPLWKEATKRIIEKLEKKGINFKELDAVELFGRDGKWHTSIFSNKVKTLEIWEVDERWKIELEQNLPKAKIRILDSIKNLQHLEKSSKFNLILIDNPMNLYGPIESGTNSPKYCEHFDVLPNIEKIIEKEAIVIFNVNRDPFDYEKFPSWKKRRDEFYETNVTDNMSIEYLIEFYKKFFQKLGFKIRFLETEVRVFFNEIDMTYYFAVFLIKS